MTTRGTRLLWIHYGEEGAKQHDFSRDKDLKQHIAQICKLFGVQESSDPYGISVKVDGQHTKYLTLADLDSNFGTTPTTTLVLRAPFKQVDSVINALNTPGIGQKKALHELSKKHLLDSQFAQEFLQRDGVGVLEGMLEKSMGGTLAKVLQALDGAMEVAVGEGMAGGLVGDEVVEQVVGYLLDHANIQVKVNSLKLLAKIIASEKSGFWVVHRSLVQEASKRGQQPYEAVISALKNEDLNMKVGALNVINAFIEFSLDKSIFEEFLVLIEDFGYLQELKAQLVTVQSLDFKRAVFWHQVAKSDHWGLEKNIPYDKENKDHEDCLYDLWNTCFPDVKLESRVSEQWKLLGFQGTDPATDFRGMGLLGLKHILYFAKNYTTTFVEMARIHDARESHYYPVSTAGINISSMLLEILNIGKGRQDKAVVGGVVTGGGGGRGGEEEDEYKIFPILFDHRRALEEMYCLVFRLFHRVWDEMNADYMDFMSVASSVKEKTVTALKVVEDLAGFAKELGVEWGGEGGTGGGGDRVSKLLDMDMVEQQCPTKGPGFRKSRQPSSNRSNFLLSNRSSSPTPHLSPHPSPQLPPHPSPAALATPTRGGSCGGGLGVDKEREKDESLLSEGVNLDIFVQLANQSCVVGVGRGNSVKEVIETTVKIMKKKMKKPKKGETLHLFNKMTGIWLDDQRKVWSYLLKENEKLELKAKPIPLPSQRVSIEIQLEATSFTQPVEYLPETTVRGVIQAIDKPKSVLQNVHLYGLVLGGEGGGSKVWLDEGQTLSSYGMLNSKLVFSMRNSTSEEQSIDAVEFQVPSPCFTPASSPSWASSTTPSSPLPPSATSWAPSTTPHTPSPPSTPVSNGGGWESWGVGDVGRWLKGIGMGEYVDCFEKGGVDGKMLGEITGPMLRNLGVPALGVRKEIMRQVKSLKEKK